MNTSQLSFCLGLAWLASFACGNAESGSSGSGGVGGAGSGAPPNSADSGSGDSGSTSGEGGAESGASLTSGGSAPANNDAGSGGEISAGSGGAPADGPIECTPGSTTTISGVVYDPAGSNPLYNVMVYVLDPNSPLPDLDSVPLGCGCARLLPEKVLATRVRTDAKGHFEIPCAPSGSVSLVVQTGKWRRVYDGVKVVANEQNVIPNLRLPANSGEGSLPNIAIATGGSDSVECVPLRFGVSASEYVAGSATGGHIHIYTGLRGASPAQGAVQAFQTLWDTQAHLDEHDVVVLGCEGEETKGGTSAPPLGATAQQYLMNYANAGGRVLAGHYHYAWFNKGPFALGSNNLATGNAGIGTIATDNAQAFPAEISVTLSNGAPFPEGSALAQWLTSVGALTSNQLPLWFANNNVKTVLQPPSTEWIRLAPSTSSASDSVPQLFSVDMPVGASGSAVCGRITYGAMHVTGGANVSPPGVPMDYPPTGTAGAGGGFPGGPTSTQPGVVPSGCAMHPLTPQEAALEFMLFDLSSCLLPIGEEPGQR
jgi:hypothetical protein